MIRLCRRSCILAGVDFEERDHAAPQYRRRAETARSLGNQNSRPGGVWPPSALACSRREVGRSPRFPVIRIAVAPRQGQGPLIDDTTLLAGRANNRVDGVLEG